MLTVRIIPCLDVKDGRVVKGVQFSNLKDAGSPVTLAMTYEQQGADEIVILDISATNENRSNRLETVKAVRNSISIPLTVGGGVRTEEDVAQLLQAGADKVAINSAAVAKPEVISKMAELFGAQCTVLAVDAKQTRPNFWEVVTHSGSKETGISVVDWVKHAEELGAGEILLTSWDKDGTKTGYDLELLKAVSSAIHLPVIASGGAASVQHFLEGIQAGADAVLAASIFHFNETSVQNVKLQLKEAGVAVRL